MEDKAASLRAIVRGRVQGVNFRHFVSSRATLLHLSGRVRNLPDGRSVEVVAEGQRADLDQLLAHLRRGTRSAVVDSVEVEWGEAQGSYRTFDIAG